MTERRRLCGGGLSFALQYDPQLKKRGDRPVETAVLKAEMPRYIREHRAVALDGQGYCRGDNSPAVTVNSRILSPLECFQRRVTGTKSRDGERRQYHEGDNPFRHDRSSISSGRSLITSP